MEAAFWAALADRAEGAPPWFDVDLLAGNARDARIKAQVDALPPAIRRHFSVKEFGPRAKAITPLLTVHDVKDRPPTLPYTSSIEEFFNWLAAACAK
jgi:hypothetical protein